LLGLTVAASLAVPLSPAGARPAPEVSRVRVSRCQVGVQADLEVREILACAEEKYEALRTLRARFRQTIVVPLLERTRTGSGLWYQKGRGRFKMEFTDPHGDLIVADGTYVWLYYPTTNPGQVIRSTIEASPTGAQMFDLQGRIFDDAKTVYEAEHVLDEEVTGKPTHLVALTPREASPYRLVRVWVDTETFLVRKFEITEENETVRTVELSQLEPDVPITDRTFLFQLPSEVDVFQG
jgi:outer membrane lipoprotein carrier protein